MSDRPADQIRKLVMFAASEDSAETAVARRKAREALAKLDTELLDTLAGQRKRLIEQLHEECRRLDRRHGRATKEETGELVSSSLLLLRHYERYDALIAAVLLLRIEDGHRLTDEERQQLDGPTEDLLDRWMRDVQERRQAAREKRRAERRDERRAARRAQGSG